MRGKSSEAKWEFAQKILYEHADAIKLYRSTDSLPDKERERSEANWKFAEKILRENDAAIKYYRETGNLPPVLDKSSENGKTTPTNPNKLHPTQSNSNPSDADVKPKPQSMLSNNAGYVEGQGRKEASVELANITLPSPTSRKREHRDTNAKEVKPNSLSENHSKPPNGCGFDAVNLAMDFTITKDSRPQSKHSAGSKLAVGNPDFEEYAKESLKNPTMPFTVFQDNPSSGKFTKIPKKDNKIWEAAKQIVSTFNSPMNSTPEQDFFAEYEFPKKIMITSMRGLYSKDAFWEYKPSTPEADTFEISGHYSANVKKSFKDIKDLTAGFNGTADSIAKVHKLFADSMTANFPYRLSGVCGNVCGKDSCRQTFVEFPSNIHIFTSRRYTDPITGNRFYNATLFSDGKFDSFVFPLTRYFTSS